MKQPLQLMIVAATLVISAPSISENTSQGKQTIVHQGTPAHQKAAADESIQVSSDAQRDESAKQELGYVLGLQAYLYGLPSLRLEEFRYNTARFTASLRSRGILSVSDSAEDGVQYNEWLHIQELQNPKVKGGGSPNVDTLYSTVSYDLANNPQILTVPAVGERYYTIQFVDVNLSNVAYLGTRTTGSGAGSYLLVGPGWQGIPPENTQLLRLPTNEGFMAMRILVDGPDDVKNVIALQDRFDLQALSALQGGTKTAELPAIPAPDKSGELSAYRRIVELAQRNPPPDAGAQGLWQSLAHIGMFLDEPFNPDSIDPAIKRGMLRAESAAADIIAWKVKNRGYKSKNLWGVDLRGGRFGQDYLARAESAFQGLIVHDPEEALVFQAYYDGQGKRLNGSKRYTLHFEAGYLPPVDGFWSITVYKNDFNLVENPIERYSIGDRTHGLRYNDDGSLTLFIQPTQPGEGTANWLPSPEGEGFRLNFRMYLPRSVMRDKKVRDNYLPPLVNNQ